VGTCVNQAGALGRIDPANNINCPAGTVYQSGSAHLRNASASVYPDLRTNLANGNFLAVANMLATASPDTGGPAGFASGWRNVNFGSVTQGNLLRNGCDRLGTATLTNPLDLINGGAATGNSSQVRCFPEDWLIANPVLAVGADGASVLGAGAVYKNTWGYTNYHHFQLEYTLRLLPVNLQAFYVASKTLALPRDFYRTNTFVPDALTGISLGSVTGFSDPGSEESRRRDYGEAGDSVRHSFRLNGVFQLPVGSGQALLSNPPGWAQAILGGWHMGVILNSQSGGPFSVFAGDMMYGASSGLGSGCDPYAGAIDSTAMNCSSGLVFPDVASSLWNNPKGQMTRAEDGRTTYFGNPNPFSLVPDPQCANGAVRTTPDRTTGGTSLASQCALRALVQKVPAGTPGAFPLSASDPTPVLIMLQNPMPGKQGSLGSGAMRQPGRFYFDASLSKTFMYTDTRGIRFRVDALNVLNHPTPSDVYLSLGPQSTPVDTVLERFNESTPARSAVASGCIGMNASCGRQVQFSVRLIQ
jgi:hypothetical protein